VKLCIPIAPKAEGGMYTFIGLLLSYLDLQGIAHTRDLDDEFDVLFVNSWVVPYETVRRAKTEHPGARVVQRVDGSSMDYGRYRSGDARQARVNLLADLTIFQSAYSKLSTTKKFRVVSHDGPIIHNPVDLALFTTEGEKLRLTPGRPAVACASWSTNRGKGTRDVDRLAAAHPDVDFVLCGRFEGLSLRNNLLYLGHVSRRDIARAFRSCDVLLNLSENDPAPNVVIEALASGLPVLYRDSGGVSELVGDCGVPVTLEGFRAQLESVLSRREAIGAAARARAAREFAPGVVFPQYLAAMASATRRPLPTTWTFVRLGARGFPVVRLGRAARPGDADGSRAERRPAAAGHEPPRVGWVTYDAFLKPKKDFADLDTFTGMRVGNIARWINANSDTFRNELYDPGRSYDLVVFQKMMDGRCQREVERLQAAGTAVVFDANVNYYEIWGDYPVAGTKPTADQQRDAVWMTRRADWVVADSSYLAAVAGKFTSRVSWIPDNVDIDTYAGVRRHENRGRLRLAWSGVSKKALHLGLIADVLRQLPHIELVLVVDDIESADVRAIGQFAPSRILPFSDSNYARTLSESDLIISPKYLTSGYEMGHSEYKITLGMGMGLPAVASPQPSYVEAIEDRGGGFVARTPREWIEALTCLAENPERRASMGALARQTVVERYATPVVARQYLDLLADVLARVRNEGTAAAC
jgi:glycosyltransferase involved in cell wall biosynthesis